MAWEYSRYEAKCAKCGHVGVCVTGSDDWGRTSTTWEGFNTTKPHQYEVGRKRTSERSPEPICRCGSEDIVVGRPVD